MRSEDPDGAAAIRSKGLSGRQPAAAGVGKGTLFRRFGDRTGLLRAVFDTRIADLRSAILNGAPPLGPATKPRERLLALLDAMVEFKLDNRKLTRALEQTSERASFLESPSYLLAHALFTDLLTGLVAEDRAAWTGKVSSTSVRARSAHTSSGDGLCVLLNCRKRGAAAG